MNNFNALQNLLNNTASEEDIALLKRLLASGEISIGGNVNQSVIIIGSGNTVELPPAALDRLNARPLLGDRDLTGDEIAIGLKRLEVELPLRAPVLLKSFQEQARRLRPILKTDPNALSESAHKELVEALAVINSLCMEAVDISFNALSLGETAPDYDARSPFRGLESFRPEDSEFFFGREALTQKLVGKIKAHSFLAVLGASGSGKSSLVMAGVIPALDSDYVVFRPGTNPLDELGSARGKSLIVVDQFEELFTLTRDESIREDFIARLLDESSRAKIILTLRSDFLAEVGAYRTLSAEIQNHLEIIPPMDVDELRRAMEGQAGVTGLRFEADLSQQILDDVAGEPGAMSLLQHALWELWNRRHGRNLRASEYRAFGGVKQAITSTAEQVYADCSKPEQDSLCDIFLRLTRLDDGDEGRDTRRRVLLGDLISSGRDTASITLLLDKLANARLVVKTVNDDKTEVEVAHEALIRYWERLRIWLNEDRDALRLRESVSESAKEWEKSGKHESLLNSRWVKLDEALLLAQDSRYRLTEIEQAYLKGCVGVRESDKREKELQDRKLQERLRWAVVASVLAAVIFLAFGGFGLIKSNEATKQANTAATAQTNAERQAKIALARQLAIQSQALFPKNDHKQQTAVLLAIESSHLFPSTESANILQKNTLSPTIKNLNIGYVHDVAFSPDGKYIVTDGAFWAYQLWNIETGKDVTGTTQGGSVNSAAFSPDSKYIITGSNDNTARVWDASTGKELARVTHKSSVDAVVFSPDGRFVASHSGDGVVYVWNPLTGRTIASFADAGQTDIGFFTGRTISSSTDSSQIDFSPNGTYMAWAVSDRSGRSVRLFNLETGIEVLRKDFDFEYNVNVVRFSPDGKYIALGLADGLIDVIETLTGKEVAVVISQNDSISSIAFSPDGKYMVSGSYDNTSRVWETLTGKEISHLTFDGSVTSVAFSPDGKYAVAGSFDGTARVFEVLTGKETSRITCDDSVNSVTFSPSGQNVVLWCQDGTVRMWKAQTYTDVIHTPDGYDCSYGLRSIKFSPNSKYIVSEGCSQFGSGAAYVWETLTGNEVSHLTYDRGANEFLFPVAFSPDGKHVVSGGGDGIVRIWETITGKEVARMSHELSVNSVAFSPDGRYVVSGSDDDTARVWEIETGREVARMTHSGVVYSVAFSPDGKYVISGSLDKTARVWDAMTGKEVSLMFHNDSVLSAAFSPDGRYVVSGGFFSGTVRIWSVMTGNEVARMNQSTVYSLAFSPDGRYVVAGGSNYPNGPNGIAQVWDAMTGGEVSQMTHDSPVNSVAFSPDGEYVVSGSNDNTARVWETQTGKEVTRITYDNAVDSVAFSPDGKYVASVSQDGVIQVKMYRAEDLIANACARVTSNLTYAEWQLYIGDALPYQAVCPNLPIEPESTPRP